MVVASEEEVEEVCGRDEEVVGEEGRESSSEGEMGSGIFEREREDGCGG